MTYRVQKGDTLWGLSRQYGIPLQKLLAQVPEDVRRDPRKLMPGMELDLGLSSSPSVLERQPSSTHPAMLTPEERAIHLGVPLARGPRPGDVSDSQRQAQYAQTRAGLGAALAGPPVGAATGGIGGALAGRGLTGLWNRGKEAWNSEGPAQQSQSVPGPDLSRVYKPQPDPGRFENMSPLLPAQRSAAEQFRGMQPGGQLVRTNPDRVAGWNQPPVTAPQQPGRLISTNPSRGAPPVRRPTRSLDELQREADANKRWNDATSWSALRENENLSLQSLMELLKNTSR